MHTLLARFCTATFLAACVLLSANSASDLTTTQAEVARLQEQVEVIEKDVDVFNAKLEAQDKRIQDMHGMTALQANHIGMVANQTSTIGSYISIASLLLIVLALLAGALAYFNTAQRAKEMAREASEQWIQKNTHALESEITELRLAVTKALADLHTENDSPASTHRDAPELMAVAKKLLSTDNKAELSPQDRAVLEAQHDALKQKRETEFNASDYFVRGLTEYAKHRFESALAAFEHALERLTPAESATLHAECWFAKGVTLAMLKRSEDAMAVYSLMDQRYGMDFTPAVREIIATALVHKGVTLGTLKRTDEEMDVYDHVAQRYAIDTAAPIREQASRAMRNKGFRLIQLNRNEDAMALYDLIDQRYCTDNSPAIREQVAMALFNKGFALGQLNRSDEEIAIYDMIDQRYSSDNTPAMREQVAMTLVNKGVTLGALSRNEEAIAVYSLIDQRYSADPAPTLREKVATALLNKGITLGMLKRSSEEIATYDLISQRYATDTSPAVREQVTKALRSKEYRQAQLNRVADQNTPSAPASEPQSTNIHPMIREKIVQALHEKSFDLVMKAKQEWTNAETREHDLGQALVYLERALSQCPPNETAMVQCNMAYVQFLQGHAQQAQTHIEECLQLGGVDLFKALHTKTKPLRLEPQDTDYEALLERLWHVNTDTLPSGAMA